MKNYAITMLGDEPKHEAAAAAALPTFCPPEPLIATCVSKDFSPPTQDSKQAMGENTHFYTLFGLGLRISSPSDAEVLRHIVHSSRKKSTNVLPENMSASSFLRLEWERLHTPGFLSTATIDFHNTAKGVQNLWPHVSTGSGSRCRLRYYIHHSPACFSTSVGS